MRLEDKGYPPKSVSQNKSEKKQLQAKLLKMKKQGEITSQKTRDKSA